MKDGRLTDAPWYPAMVKRRKLLTALIIAAAERSKERRNGAPIAFELPVAMYRLRCLVGAPVGAPAWEFQAYVAWEEAWVNAIKEERKCLQGTQHQKPQRFSLAGSRPKRRTSGLTP